MSSPVTTTGNVSSSWEILAKAFDRIRSLEKPRVLEIGTRRWEEKPNHKKAQVLAANPTAEYVGIDYQAGDDVDIVADITQPLLDPLTSPDGVFRPFDAILCGYVLEHVAKPFAAARYLAQVASPSCLLWVGTHPAYPIHNHPSDYFRYTIPGLCSVFEEFWTPLMTCYSIDGIVIPFTNQIHHRSWNFEARCPMLVDGLFVRR